MKDAITVKKLQSTRYFRHNESIKKRKNLDWNKMTFKWNSIQIEAEPMGRGRQGQEGSGAVWLTVQPETGAIFGVVLIKIQNWNAYWEILPIGSNLPHLKNRHLQHSPYYAYISMHMYSETHY